MAVDAAAPWEGDELVKPARKRPPAPSIVAAQPTGQAHDGDTFRLQDGRNARLYGYDAYELGQEARASDGSRVPIGQQSRSALLPYLPGATVTNAGRPSYGRPVVSLGQGGLDPVVPMLQSGWGLAAPEYLKGSDRLGQYMEAERFARQNRQGGFGLDVATPRDYRQGNGSPWAEAQPGKAGESVAVFADEPTPFQGLRPEIEQGYISIWQDMSSKPADLLAFAQANGFKLDPADVQKRYAKRDRDRNPARDVRYAAPPRLLTDQGDGRLGATLRGFADPVNILDEMGAFVDTLGGTAGRESVWNSERRFGDILDNNLTQNRGILANDEADYPWWRFGGQLASGVMIPGASVEAVGLNAARSALRGGATRMGARAAAGRAVTQRLATVGAIEGAAAGIGQGETTQERIMGGVIGAPAGAILGVGAGTALPAIGRFASRRLGRRAVDADADPSAQQYVNGAGDTVQADAEDLALAQTPDADGAWWEEADVVAPMTVESDQPTLYGPDVGGGRADTFPPRPLDRIDVTGPVRRMSDGLTDADRLRLTGGIAPSDVTPLPSNTVADLNEAMAIDASRQSPVRAPNEMTELGRRNLPSPRDGTRTLPKRGPVDMVTWLRTQGGIRAQGGELEHAGINNAARADLDFAGGENRFGPLVSNSGWGYDTAAQRAWEAGYFPELSEPPTPREFLEALVDTHTGNNRRFLPDDVEEVARFNAARDQRYAVESARADGAPLYQDRGQDVGLEDLESNTPPVRAYEEWGENAPNYAANVRLDKLDSPLAIKRALVTVARASDGFDAARRGRITHAETASLAADLNMTPKQLLDRRKGQAFNAEEALAARQILAKSGNELVAAARRIKAGEASERDMLAWRTALTRHAAIQEQVSGMTAEAGRALSAFRAVADSRAVNGSVLREAMTNLGGADDVLKAANSIIDASDSPARLNSMAKTLTSPKMRDKLLSLMYFSQLSSPVTHAVNIMSNTMTSVAQLPEMAVAAGVGKLRSIVSTADADRVLFSEVGQRAVGWLAGAKEGFANLGYTLRTGETSDAFAKFETPSAQRAFEGPLGVVVDAPMRALSAEDELFKAMARQMDIRGLAMRQAKLKEQLTGQAARDRAAELAANPTPEMMEQAFDYARYVTFQRPLGSVGAAGQSFLNKAWPLRVFVPYVRTPTNLLKFAAERSPVAPALWKWSRDFKAGGAKRDAAVARWIVGSSATMMALEAAQSGLITGGGPSDPRKRALLEADGWQPYSIRVGDTYYSYRRLDPFSTTIGFAADYIDLQDNMSEDEKEKVAAILVGSALQNLSSKTWLSGMSSLGEALGDWGRYGENLLAGLAGNVVPSAVAAAARVDDPIQREAGDWLSRIRSRIPIVSRSLPPRRNVLGEPVIGFNGGGLAALSPVVSSTLRNSPEINALIEAGMGLSKPSRSLTDPNTGIRGKLSPEAYSEYQRLSGRALRPALKAMTTSEEWGRLSFDEREEALSDVVKDARKEGKRGLYGKTVGGAAMPWDADPIVR